MKDGYNNGTYWAYYECDDGFEMEGGAVAYCNGSTAMNVPSCECKHSKDLSEDNKSCGQFLTVSSDLSDFPPSTFTTLLCVMIFSYSKIAIIIPILGAGPN